MKIESSIFKSKWFYLSTPRHLSHFTDKGIKKFLENEGFMVVEQKPIFAVEYALWGFVQSFFNLFQSQDKLTSTLMTEKNVFKKFLYAFPALLIFFAGLS
jgi:hypothetical protein